MLAVITGGLGFIGLNLVTNLASKYKKVVIIDNCSNHFHGFDSLIQNFDNLEIIKDNILSKASLSLVKNLSQNFSSCDLWHLAANSDILKGSSNIIPDLDNTFKSTVDVIELLSFFPNIRVRFCSTSAVYGDQGDKKLNELDKRQPISYYGLMKKMSEDYLYLQKMRGFLSSMLIFRFPNVVGFPATHGVLYDLLKKIRQDPSTLPILGNGSQVKNYLHITDLIDAILFLHFGSFEGVHNIGNFDSGVSVKEIVNYICTELKISPKLKYSEGSSGWVGDVPKYYYDTSKINLLGWYPKLNSEQSIRFAIREIYGQF